MSWLIERIGYRPTVAVCSIGDALLVWALLPWLWVQLVLLVAIALLAAYLLHR